MSIYNLHCNPLCKVSPLQEAKKNVRSEPMYKDLQSQLVSVNAEADKLHADLIDERKVTASLKEKLEKARAAASLTTVTKTEVPKTGSKPSTFVLSVSGKVALSYANLLYQSLFTCDNLNSVDLKSFICKLLIITILDYSTVTLYVYEASECCRPVCVGGPQVSV